MERDREQMGMGWLPDLPDYRDYTSEHEEIKPMLEEMKVSEPENKLTLLYRLEVVVFSDRKSGSIRIVYSPSRGWIDRIL